MRQVEYTDEGKLVQLKRGRDPSCTELSFITTGQKIKRGRKGDASGVMSTPKSYILSHGEEDQNFCFTE